MNPGLVVKLRPAGPWRIGPDSGARNRVDAIYHSDSLYSAVTSAMSRMGSLARWLDATARSQTPAVCFSSCYPFLEDIGFVVPPRTIWPPTSPAAMSARVRWKSARFIPLSLVESILAGKRLNENQWSVDGPSACLVPAGKAGPFRTSVRWNAAVDRLSGASDRYSTACIEFREGCGLWTVAGFRDEPARDEWQEPVKAAFRLLADSGFGGERSRGWGRSETPEFVEGTLPGLIVEYKRREPSPSVEEPPLESEAAEPLVGQALPPAEPTTEPLVGQAGYPLGPPADAPAEPEPAEPATEPEAAAPEPPVGQAGYPLGPPADAPAEPEPAEPATEPKAAAPEPPVGQALPPADAPAEPAPAEPEPADPTTEPEAAAPEPPVGQAGYPLGPPADAPAEPEPEPEPEAAPPEPLVGQALPPADAPAEPTTEPEAAPPEPLVGQAGYPLGPPADAPAEPTTEPAPVPEPAPQPAAAVRAPDLTQPMRVAAEREAAPAPPVPAHLQAHWLLSLFTPAAADAVDWGRGSYSVLARGGRIDSPSPGSGDLKKQIQMVAEGSVLYVDGVPLGAAADVAPDGFAHPVFRAGFALAIPLPEVH
jgi:CRISPR type III-A-associated RAMP protein Csm4